MFFVDLTHVRLEMEKPVIVVFLLAAESWRPNTAFQLGDHRSVLAVTDRFNLARCSMSVFVAFSCTSSACRLCSHDLILV